jgi:hypothetical protein
MIWRSMDHSAASLRRMSRHRSGRITNAISIPISSFPMSLAFPFSTPGAASLFWRGAAGKYWVLKDVHELPEANATRVHSQARLP